MDGDRAENLDEILDSIDSSSSNLQPYRINLLAEYLLQNEQVENLNRAFHFLLSSLTTKTDLKYKKQITELLKSLAQEKPLLSSVLFGQLFPLISNLRRIVPTKTISKTVIFYSEIFTIFKWKNSTEQTKKSLIIAHCALVSFYAKLRVEKLYDKNYNCLKKFLLKITSPNHLDSYCMILKESSCSDSASNIDYTILWDNVIRFVAETDNLPLISAHKSSIIDLFVKNVILSKTKITDQYDPNSFKNTLQQTNQEEFKVSIFPSMQKAILRNPEVSLSQMIFILNHLDFDLSNYFKDICKVLGNHLHSKNDLLQEESLNAVKVVAGKCSDPTAIEFGLNHFQQIYNGSEGKLTVLGQKHTVIKSIGNLSYNKVGRKENLLHLALEELTKMFKQETVESSFILLFAQMKLWIQNSPGCPLPEKLWKFFKDYSQSKSATPTLIAALYECLIVSFSSGDQVLNSDLIAKIDDNLQSILVNSSKNVQSSLTKIQILVESLHASLLLMKIHACNRNFIKEKIRNFWQSLQNLQTFTFLTDKFVAQASVDNLLCLNDFIYCLNQSITELNEDNRKIVRRTCLLLMCHSCRDVRDKALESFKNHCQTDEHYPLNMIKTFNELFQEDNHEELAVAMHDKFKLQCCQTIIKQLKWNGKMETQDMFHVLHLCHNPSIYRLNPKLFADFLHKSLSAEEIQELLDVNFKNFIEIIFEVTYGEATTLNLVNTLMKLNPHKFSAHLVQKISDNLELRLWEYKSITNEDYEIYKLPDGQLYNRTAVIEAGQVQQDKNLKRESKLYSHKEQLAEIQLRKELEAKNKNDDKLDLDKLSKKQKEIYAQEMEKEKAIRDRLRSLNKQFSFYTRILLAMIHTNPIVASIHFKDIIFIYIELFSSRLTFEEASNFFKQISHKMMISDQMKMIDYSKYVDIICNLIIKLYQSSEKIPTKDSLELIVQTVEYIYNKTCLSLLSPNRLTTPAFSFTFPLFRYILLYMNRDQYEDYDKLVEKCLQIITHHSLMRCYDENDLENLRNPQNLPIKLILETLLSFMEKDVNSECDELISSTIIQVIQSVNNEIGCGKANTRDIFTLLKYLTHQDDLIRSTCFESLYNLASNVLPFIQDEHCKGKLIHRCYVGQFDILPDCQTYAKKIFEMCHLEITAALLDIILSEDVENVNSVMTFPVAEAFKNLIEQFPSELDGYFERLMQMYKIKALSSIPSVDAFGRPLSKVHVDHFEPRLTIAFIFKHIVNMFVQQQVEAFIKFLIPQALSDNNESVRSAMLDAGCELMDIHGKNNINYFLEVFETFLDSAPDDHQNDLVRKSVIIMMGTLAKHIDDDNPKLKPILSKLVESLSTPSQIVQEAIANCLQHLIPKFKDDAPALLQKLLEFLFESDIYGERKGAAYGIAGIVKGLGILSINKLGIMDALTQAIQAKDKPNNREGALFAFEMLSHMLGRLFEPYVVHILPYLLDCFGDSSTRVRHAADDTAKVIMSNLSAYGVTLIYPAILKALEDDSWRKKTSSIDLLGSMAYCAPKQLSQCLPKIVPKLMAVMTDSHPKVQKSAAQALKQIGSVIKNPEIQEIVPIILDALQDPGKNTHPCLLVMMKMKFVHVIDPPSLALIMPMIERAFQIRSTETRKMASQIVGNMYALAKNKDLSPYLPSIIPGLKNSLLDPVPEVRTASARALGAMVKSLGNEILNDVRPWLEQVLRAESSSVDRSGAAQGLAEVLGGLGKEHLDKYMPKILEITESQHVPPHVKDGFLMLFIYLPSVFSQHFLAYVSRVINPILKALADDTEYVRETALRAGQRIVNVYADTSIQLLLPELENGLFNENWRIRYSSVQLLGDLLFKITGLSGKMTSESNHEDDNFGTEQSHQALFDALGEERRSRVLSGLYMGRSDVSLQVRQASLHVWKVIIPNTPRTLKEILPVLFPILLECMASNYEDKKRIGARTLGDLVRKLGDRILPEILPILEDGLKSDRPDQRQGVCIGLSEIIASTGRDMVRAYADNFVTTIRKALFDPLPEVRQSAAQSFDQLFQAIGEKALPDILNHLLDNIDHPEHGEHVLDSLREIIAYKSRVILPNLIPRLINKTLNIRALSFISSVAGEAFSKNLHSILPPLLKSLQESIDQPNYEERLEYCKNVVICIADEDGARTLILTLVDACKSEDSNMKRAAITLLAYYCSQTKPTIFETYRVRVLSNFFDLLGSNDESISNQCTDALTAIFKNMEVDEQLEAVPEAYRMLRRALEQSNVQPILSVDGKENLNDELYFPGFRTSKCIQSLLNLFSKALFSSDSDLKQEGVDAYRLIISYASPKALEPSVLAISGSLLRMILDRLNTHTKIISNETLSLLLLKVPNQMKPFLPPLQSVFLRSLVENDRLLRLKAAVCLSRLARVHRKVDTLFIELLKSLKKCQSESPDFLETGYYAVRLALAEVGANVSQPILLEIYQTVDQEWKNSASLENVRMTAASILGVLCSFVRNEFLQDIVQNYLLNEDNKEDLNFRLFQCIALEIALKEAFETIFLNNEGWQESIYRTVIGHMNSDKLPLVYHGIKSAAYIIKHYAQRNQLPRDELLQTFGKLINNASNDIKRTVASSTIFLCDGLKCLPPQVYTTLIPHLVNGTKEKNTAVKAHSEQALICLLQLDDGDGVVVVGDSPIYQQCLKNLSQGAAESLKDCVAKIKNRKTKTDHQKLEEFDDTLLSRNM